MKDLAEDQTAGVFKTFPEFTKLTLAHREQYEALIRELPPISDISFPTLMLWWNHLDGLAVSLLNGNLVLSYWLPGSDELSGLSLVGAQHVDESVCSLFDYLLAKGERARLLPVPEFVISHMQHPELYQFEAERGQDEYVIPLAKLYPLNHLLSYRRYRVRRFLDRVDEENIIMRSIDLSDRANQQLLLDANASWPTKGTLNEVPQTAAEALDMAIRQGDAIGIENACLFVGGKLHAYVLYQLPADKRYAILCQAKFSYELPYLFDYTAYAFARRLIEQGITYFNLDLDFNVPMLRTVKLALGPENYFRKYTVRPAERGR